MKRWLKIGALVLVVVVAAGVWAGRGTYATGYIGTGYVAKQTCSCMFVVGRTAEACSTDYDAQVVQRLKVQPAASSVTVSALGGLLSAKAEFEEGFGCHLVN
jgi:ABC-type molybdate transport system substrate-binding protein